MKLRNTVRLVALALAANGCLLPGEADGSLDRRNYSPYKRLCNFEDFPIGKGDRFNKGRHAPRGLGTDNRELESILNVGEVESGLKGLANHFGEVKLFTAPHSTFENRQVHGATIGTPKVFIQSGIHARERGGPDNVLYFVSDLLAARANCTGVKYGNQSYTNAQVTKALSAGIAIVPLVNPDGVAYDQRSNACWRKNRNTTSAKLGLGTNSTDPTIGVDLNRNFAVMWDYKRLFNLDAKVDVSDDPGSAEFHGTAPLSEAETQNVAWVMSQHTQLSWFLDLHSFGGDILYGWGDDDPQTTDRHQSFTNNTYDGQRGFIGEDPANSVYGEYIESADLDAQTRLSKRMSRAMSRAGSVKYVPKPSSRLYPTAGDSIEYALGQYYGHQCGANRIQGLAIEFGTKTNSANCAFYPNADKYHESMRQVAVGLMELLLAAAGTDGDRKVYECGQASLTHQDKERGVRSERR